MSLEVAYETGRLYKPLTDIATSQQIITKMVRDNLPAGETLTIPAEYQMIVFGSYTVAGDLYIAGSLVIL